MTPRRHPDFTRAFQTPLFTRLPMSRNPQARHPLLDSHVLPPFAEIEPDQVVPAIEEVAASTASTICGTRSSGWKPSRKK